MQQAEVAKLGEKMTYIQLDRGLLCWTFATSKLLDDDFSNLIRVEWANCIHYIEEDFEWTTGERTLDAHDFLLIFSYKDRLLDQDEPVA